MSILQVLEKNNKKGSVQLVKGEIKRVYTRYFQVQSGSLSEDPVTVMFASDPHTSVAIPTLESSWGTSDPSIVCTKIEPTKREDAPYWWDVEVEYTQSENQNANPPTGGGNPLDPSTWQPELNITWVKRMVPVEIDKSNPPKAICSSAKEPYFPPAQIDREDMRICFGCYEATLNVGEIQTYNNTINSNLAFGIVTAGTGKLSITASLQKINNQNWYRKTFICEVNKDGWNLKLIDKGTKHWTDRAGNEMNSASWPSDAKQQDVCDDNGVPTKTPRLLNGCGGKLAAGATPVVFPAGGYVVYDVANWADLELPDLSGW